MDINLRVCLVSDKRVEGSVIYEEIFDTDLE